MSFFSVTRSCCRGFVVKDFLEVVECLSFVVTLVAPSLCIKVLAFRRRLLPAPLLLKVVTRQRKIPFPTIVRILLVRIAFRVLHRTNIQVPETIKRAISVINTLIVKRTTTRTKVVSGVVIVVITVATVTGFMSPACDFTTTTELLEFLLVVMSTFLNLCKILVMLIFVITRLDSLESFNIPCLSPITPFVVRR